MLGAWDGARGFRADDTPNRIEVAALPHRWLAQRHEIGGGPDQTVTLAKQGPIRLRRTHHFLHHSHIVVGFLLLSALRVTSTFVAKLDL